MKRHILNDLHLEFEDFVPLATDANVVGDIGVGMDGLRWAEPIPGYTPDLCAGEPRVLLSRRHVD